jgi:hypothetical protein
VQKVTTNRPAGCKRGRTDGYASVPIVRARVEGTRQQTKLLLEGEVVKTGLPFVCPSREVYTEYIQKSGGSNVDYPI